MDDLSKASKRKQIFLIVWDQAPLLSRLYPAIFWQMVPWFDLCTKESEVALFAVFGWKLCLLAYYFSCSGQDIYFLTTTAIILVKIGKSQAKKATNQKPRLGGFCKVENFKI
jgi:hypothetical protein